jgi:hypothetical protein
LLIPEFARVANGGPRVIGFGDAMRFGVVPFAAPVTGVPPPLVLQEIPPRKIGVTSSSSIIAVPSLRASGVFGLVAPVWSPFFQLVAKLFVQLFRLNATFHVLDLLTQTYRSVYRFVLSWTSPSLAVVV